MRNFLRTLVCVSLVFLSTVAILGQDVSAVPKRKFKHQADFSSVYDKAKDQTAVVMHWYHVRLPTLGEKNYLDLYYSDPGRSDSQLDIQAAFSYPGRVLVSPPEAVQFDIRIRHQGPAEFKTQEMPELNAVIDGETISLGKTLLVSTKTVANVHGPTQMSYEVLSSRFTYQGLLRLVGAKRVTMKVGRAEFALEDKHVEALRDLASRMVP